MSSGSISFAFIILIFIFNQCNGNASLPSLPSRFTAIVEANIVNKNITWLMEEWYDYNASLAKREFYYGSLIYTTYEDFSNDNDELWTYITTHDDTSNAISCTLESYENSANTPFGDQSNSGGLVSSAQWFQFGANFSEHYIGYATVRGIAVEGWKRNATWNYTSDQGWEVVQSYDIIYYFSVSSWNWFYSTESRIPVRVVLDGSRTTYYGNGTSYSYDYLHNYDYVQFFEDDLTLAEELDFDIPDFYEQCNVTSYCDYYNDAKSICTLTKGPSLPTLSYSFSSTVEITTASEIPYYTQFSELTSISEFYYDYDGNRAHVIWRFLDGYYKNAFHQLDLEDVEDGGQSWVWLGDGVGSTATEIDDDIMYCQMNGTSTNFTGWDYVVPLQNGHVIDPHKLFLFDDHDSDPQISDEIWMGYTTVRNIPAEKWKATLNVAVIGDENSYFWPLPMPSNQKVEINATVYWYFSRTNWTFGYARNESRIPLRTEIVGTLNVFNISDGADILVESYDMEQTADVIAFLPETPDDAYFDLPTFWRRDCVIDDAYCNDEEHEEHHDEDICDKGLDLPTLPNTKYFDIVEVNDLINNSSYVLKEWYNYDTDEYRLEFYYDEYITVMYDSLDTDKRWQWTHPINDTDNIISCSLVSYSSVSVANGWASETSTTGHLKSVSDYWQFGGNYSATYLGRDFTVRGIDARAWFTIYNETQRVNDSYTISNVFDATWYFADETWDYYKAVETADVPIRIEIEGTTYPTNTETKQIMEVVSFFSGPEAFDEDDMSFVFEDWYSQCDVSSYCADYPDDDVCSDARGPSMPTLPYQFFAAVEGSVNVYDADDTEIYNGTWVIEEYYDYDGNRAHVVLHSGPNWQGDAMHQLDLLDKEQKWIWFGDAFETHGEVEIESHDDEDDDDIRQCAMTLTQSNFSGVDIFITEVNGHIASPSKWMRWNDSSTTTTDIWMGYEQVRGIKAEKWQSTWSEYDEVAASAFADAYAVQFDAVSTYYWSTPDWNMYGSNWDTVPVKLELEGTYTLWNYSEADGEYNIFWQSNKISSVYDMMAFNANMPDEDYFEIPTYWRQECDISDDYCDKYPSSEQCYDGPSLPDFPEAFSTIVSCAFVSKNYTMTIEEYFDYDGNRELLVIHPYSASDGNLFVIGNTSITNKYLEDGRAFWVWSDDGDDDDNCYLERAEQLANSSRTPINTYFFTSGTREHVTPSAELYTWIKNTSTQHYMGQEYVRGILCDRWDAVVNESYQSDGIREEFGGTISYYFMAENINTLYPDYNIPVRCHIEGFFHEENVNTNEILYDNHFNHYYDFINFKPGKPAEYYFVPPSNITCNFSLWCNDLDIPEDEEIIYQDLIDLCDEMDEDGLVETECYFNSCGDIYNRYTTKEFCNDSDGLSAGWIVLMIMLTIIGCIIGAFLFRWRVRRQSVSFRRMKDTEQDPNL